MLKETTNKALLVETLKDKAIRANGGYKFKGLTAGDFKDASNPNFSLYRDAVEVYRVQMFDYSNDISELSNRDLDNTVKRILSLFDMSREERDALCKRVGSHKHFVAKRYGQTLTDEGRLLVDEIKADYATQQADAVTLYNSKYVALLAEFAIRNESELTDETSAPFMDAKGAIMAELNAKKEELEKAESDAIAEIKKGAVWTNKAFRAVSPSTFRTQFEHAIADLMCGITLADAVEKKEFTSEETWAKTIETAKKVGVKKAVIQKMRDTGNHTGLQAVIKETREAEKAKKKAKAAKAKAK